jgi:acyl-CoA thioesterase-2
VTTAFLDLLDLDELSPDLFTAVPECGEVLFGGLVMALALKAASSTVPDDQLVHALHAHFVRGGSGGFPLRIAVTRTRDGRAFTTREVVVSQHDRPIALLTMSFHADEAGPLWQAASMKDLGDADELQAVMSTFGVIDPIEVRATSAPTANAGERPRVRQHPYWSRTCQALPDDPVVHRCAIAFTSDYLVILNAPPPGEVLETRDMVATIEQTVWFHRPARGDEWLRYGLEQVTIGGGRTFVQGAIQRRDGLQVASFAQEIILRPGQRDARGLRGSPQ